MFFYIKGKEVSFNPKIFVNRARGGSQPENFLNPKLFGGGGGGYEWVRFGVMASARCTNTTRNLNFLQS